MRRSIINTESKGSLFSWIMDLVSTKKPFKNLTCRSGNLQASNCWRLYFLFSGLLYRSLYNWVMYFWKLIALYILTRNSTWYFISLLTINNVYICTFLLEIQEFICIFNQVLKKCHVHFGDNVDRIDIMKCINTCNLVLITSSGEVITAATPPATLQRRKYLDFLITS